MFSKNITPFHSAVLSARGEAKASGSRTIEAEHILLALAGQEGTDAREILESAGLDHASIHDALEREFEESLRAVGVSLEDSTPVSETWSPAFRPRFGRSAKLALERVVALESKRFAPHLEPIHLLIGVLYAKAGTVPRILTIAGVDAADLRKRAESALSASRGI